MPDTQALRRSFDRPVNHPAADLIFTDATRRIACSLYCMRIEPAPYVFRNEDRRQRFADRRVEESERRAEAASAQARASHAAPKWFAPAFGAHILGQSQPPRVSPTQARRAYAQPEARTPLRPRIVTSA